ncbi:MAG TPA: hypothetical protein VFA35_10275, partial [Burkholderiaceae bacterium]|nr:hypothetical protein [Burkholderiaceae bacterium]
MNHTHTTRAVLAALFALCAPLAAQSPLQLPMAADNCGPPGGTVYFDLDVLTTVTFTQFDVNTLSLPGTAGSVNVWIGPHTWVGASGDPTAWTLAATGPVTAADVDTPSPCTLAQPFALGPGTYALAIEHVGLQPAYTNGDGTNQAFANSELSFRAGAATPAAFAGPVASPRVFNGAIWYTLGGTPLPLASSIPFGTGCYAVQGSFSELFPAVPGQRTFDLDNTTLHLVPNAQGGYDVTRT